MTTHPEGSPPVFPTLTSVKTAPTRLTPGQGLGIRATVTVTVTDHPYTDVGVDPYLSDRNYIPEDTGSFWGKWLAANEYYEGRPITVQTGYLDGGQYDSANMRERLYILDRISGPDANGRVTVVGKDPLKFADGERRKWPAQSTAKLDGDINDSTTSVNITDASGEIDSAYSSGQVYVRIDDEVMEVTNTVDNGSGSWTLTVTRATLPAIYSGSITAAAHDDGASVQSCYYYNDQRIDAVIYQLLNTAAGIDSAYLPLTDWQTEIEFGFQNYTLSCLLVEPTSVKQLLEELTELSIMIWWDERDQEVKLATLLPRTVTGTVLTDDDNLISGSVNTTRMPKERVSQVWLAYADRNPLLDRDKLETYSVVDVDIDSDGESADAYGEPRIKRIFSRWLPIGKGSVVNEITRRLLNQYKRTKTMVKFALDPKDDEFWTGDIIKLQTRYLQDAYGANTTRTFRVLEVNERFSASGVVYDYTAQEEYVLTRIGLITPDTNPEDEPNPFPDYSSASDALKNKYAFIAPDEDGFSDGSPAYEIG